MVNSNVINCKNAKRERVPRTQGSAHPSECTL